MWDAIRRLVGPWLGPATLQTPMKRRVASALHRALPGEIDCRSFHEFALDYVEGTLTPEQRTAFEWHLSVCRACDGYFRSYLATIDLTDAAYRDPPEFDPTTEAPQDLIDAMLAARRSA